MPEKAQTLLAVCCATRARPVMLEALLGSFARLEMPPGAEVVFVVVENDSAPSCEPIVERALNGCRFVYAVEPVAGIARARNRAVAVALAEKADAILFVDDDETVDRHWLVRLHAAWDQGKGLLLGGPVRIAYDRAPANLWQRLMQQGLRQRFEKRERNRARKALMGQPVLISTNNCLVDASLYQKLKLSYDTELHSGSDLQFHRHALDAGVAWCWVPDAIVHETWPQSRVSLGYSYFRAREQAKTRFGAGKQAALRALAESAALLLMAPVQLVFLPVTGPSGAFQLARNLGGAAGRLQALLGVAPKLYSDPTGH